MKWNFNITVIFSEITVYYMTLLILDNPILLRPESYSNSYMRPMDDIAQLQYIS